MPELINYNISFISAMACVKSIGDICISTADLQIGILFRITNYYEEICYIAPSFNVMGWLHRKTYEKMLFLKMLGEKRPKL